MEEYKINLEKLNDLKRVQNDSVITDEGDGIYNIGLYNGIELCIACLEGREPEYK